MKSCNTCQYQGWGFRYGENYKKCMDLSIPCRDVNYICGNYLAVEGVEQTPETLDDVLRERDALLDEVAALKPICRRLTDENERIKTLMAYVKEQRQDSGTLVDYAVATHCNDLSQRWLGQCDAYQDVLMKWEELNKETK